MHLTIIDTHQGGREDIIQLLLTQNADPNAVDFDGSSPFLLACGHNRVQCAQLLSKVTASVEYDHLLCVGAASDGDGGRVDNGDSDLRVSGIAKATVAVHGTASPHVIHTVKGGNGGDCGDAAETPDGRNSHSNNTAVDTAAVSTKSDWSKTSADAGRESRDDDARHRSEGTSACTLPTPEWSRAWMTHCRRKAQARAAVRFHPTGVMDAVHTVDAVFSVQECKEILSHLHAKVSVFVFCSLLSSFHLVIPVYLSGSM